MGSRGADEMGDKRDTERGDQKAVRAQRKRYKDTKAVGKKKKREDTIALWRQETKGEETKV